MSDEFHKYSKTIDSVAEEAFAITPNDASDLPKATRSLYVGTDGDVHITTVKDSDVTLKNVIAGSVLPIRVKKVHLAGTTATDLVALL